MTTTCIAIDSRSRYRGCLLGGAVGDALGAPVEFLSREEIRRRFGARGISDYVPAYGRLGSITDDTQMTLFTAEGLMRGLVRQAWRGMASPEVMVGAAYLRWLHTQGEKPSTRHEAMLDGWMMFHRELFHRRAPGNTCLEALCAKESAGCAAHNDSKGCGGVMRVAPVGLFTLAQHGSPVPLQDFDWGCSFSRLTHGHPSGILPGGVFAVLVGMLAGGGALDEALGVAIGLLKERPSHAETLTALERARESAASGMDAVRAIDALGQGWVAEEALAISVYCALVSRSFEAGVLLAVNHSGDSDSTGAITGNLLGAALGIDAIPDRWLAPLELREVITQVADDLHDLRTSRNDDPDLEKIGARYPGW
ncbi:MAG: ADP-ribosylglycohydrolase family protein [Pseudomonadota bacterium]